jgi:PhnB protein
MTDTPRESLMQGVIPYLAIDGARRAVDFYRKAFDAKVFGEISDMPGTDKVANVSVVINGGVMMLSDHFAEHGQPAAKAGVGYTLTLVITDGDTWWKRAVDAGCEVTVPFEQQFWGDRYGRLRDPFGIDWAFNEPSAENRAKAAHLKPA